MGKDEMAYRNSVAIVESFWNELWKHPQNPDAIDRLVTEDFILTSGGDEICSRQEFKRWVKRLQAQVHDFADVRICFLLWQAQARSSTFIRTPSWLSGKVRRCSWREVWSEGGSALLYSKRIRSNVALAIVIAAAGALNFAQSAEGQNKAATPSAPAATTDKLSPVPAPGPLAQPRSPQQLGVPALQTLAEVPEDNPQTLQKIALGQKLFFDPRLSVDGTVACAACHNPDRAFTDGRPTSVGVQGRVGQRNAPTVLNAVYNKAQFWDGRAKTLEDQAGFPMTNPSEMGQPTLDAAVAKIAAIPEYEQEFQTAFGQPPNSLNLVRAIAAYERTLISFDSPFDRFIAGDPNAVDAPTKRGWELFHSKAHCARCHASVNRDVTYFTDFDFHNIGIGILRHNVVPLAQQAERLIAKNDLPAVDQAAIQSDLSVLGRFLVTRKDADTASFKTPGLRNVLITAPYFHDGSQETLWDVMDHYNKGDGLKDPWLDEDIEPLALTENEIDDLVAFMVSLTSAEYKEIGEKELARQRALSRISRPQRDTARAFAPKQPQPKPPCQCP
jgi:cytochrome c peroxidase